MGVVVAGCAHSGSTPATTSARPAPQLHYVALPAEHARAIHYRPDALTLYSPRPGYRPAVSPRQVLRLYYSWPAGPKLKGVPTIQLKTVNDGNPNPSAHDYPGWVVTFRHTKPISYGPASVSQKADCAWVSSDVTALQKSIYWSAWKARGIDILSTGPTETGYLRVGVAKHVAQAQAAFDAWYGTGIIRVVKAKPAIAATLTG